MQKKIVIMLLTVIMVIGCLSGFSGCSNNNGKPDKLKIGFILLGDEYDAYSKNYLEAIETVKKEMTLSDDQIMIATNVPDSDNSAYEVACGFAEGGCSIIFGASYGYESYLLQAAEEYPNVEFCHASGVKAHTSGLKNFHNAYANIYEGRYVSGIAAGMKLNEMIKNGQFSEKEAKIGYVGAFPSTEVKSGFSAFYLGAKSVCPSVTMDVKYTSTWGDQSLEYEFAKDLIEGGAKIISAHADTFGSPNACEENGHVFNCAYNYPTIDACPNTYIMSCRINWVPYLKYIIGQVTDGKTIDVDWSRGFADDAVTVDINAQVAAEGTKNAVDQAVEGLKSGKLNVFDLNTFTVGGEHLQSYIADVDAEDQFIPDTEVVKNGVFLESTFRSAPYFSMDIDGIRIINKDSFKRNSKR